jgi:hypothetical protein
MTGSVECGINSNSIQIHFKIFASVKYNLSVWCRKGLIQFYKFLYM